MSRATGALSVVASVFLGLILIAMVIEPETSAPARNASPAPGAEEPPPKATTIATAEALPVTLAAVALPAPPAPRESVRSHPPLPDPRPTPAIAPLKPAPAKPAPPKPEARAEPATQVTPLRPRLEEVTPPEPKILADAPASSPPPEPDADAASPQVIAHGRTLLRLLEHGVGPRIEIAWPDSRNGREALFDTLRHCYDMAVALMKGDGALFGPDGPANEPWRPDMDRYSGFARESGTQVTGDEASLVAALRRRHPAVRGAVPVRLFPRAMDAMLLGGIKRLAGGRGAANTVAAVYRIEGREVWVEDLRVDDRRVPGRIDLSGALGRNCP